VVTSSAVVVSSAISSAGLSASAAAIITRCRWPPESLMRIGADQALRIREVHRFSSCRERRAFLSHGCMSVVDGQNLRDLLPDLGDRV